jgi:hypothetical protein
MNTDRQTDRPEMQPGGVKIIDAARICDRIKKWCTAYVIN